MTSPHRTRNTTHQPRKPALSLLSASLMLAFSPAHAVQVFDIPLTQTFSGVISGTESVTKSGVGTLTFTGANTYTGGTIITAGTLQIGDGGTTGSIVGNVTNNAALIFNRSNYMGFAGNISGSGSLTKLGAGTLQLTGNNSYTGGTTVSGGWLYLGDSLTKGYIVGNVSLANNAGLSFYNSGNTFDGVISGNGRVEKNGVGTLTLTNANTYTGGTTIQQGTLVIGAGGTTGSIVGNVTNTGTLAFNRSDNTSFAGLISGSGSLIKSGSNTLTLTGANSYTGVTTIQGGTLQIGNGGTTGSIAGNVANAGNLVFNRSDSSIFAGAISGNGNLTKLGAGTLTFTGANTYTGGTTLSSGTLQIGNGGTTGTLAGNVANAGALVFNRSDSSTFSGIVSGGGSLTKLGAGTLTLNGANTHTGGTTISGGTLEIGLYGAIPGNVVNNGTLAFNAQNTYVTTIVGGVVSGSGSLLKSGGGTGTHTVVLTGANTYTGGTTVSAGVLSIGNGGTTGSIVGNVVNNATLAFNRSDNTSFAGIISGSGGVTKSGAGTLTVTGNNTYTGTTNIQGGALQIGNGGTTGWIAGNFSGGTLIFNRSDDIATNKSISSILVKQGAGTLTYTGQKFGNVVVSNGTFQVGDGGTQGSISANITNNAAVVFNRSDNTLFGAYTMSGSGSMAKQGTGTLVLSGNNTYTGGTTISAGTLQIGQGSTYGAIVGDVTNNAALVFNRSDNITFAGAIGGSGSLTKQGTNTLTLTGATTYSGGTTIAGGTLALSGAGNSNLAGAIGGSGSLAKSGAGVLTLGGASTYTGGTSLSGGTLKLDGSLTGTSGVSLAAGATLETDALASIALGGTGARMDVAGVLSPGGDGTWGNDKGGQLNLALGAGGKLGFAAGSTLLLDLGLGDRIAFDQAGDWLEGSGNATLQLNYIDYNLAYTVFQNVSTQNFTLAGITGYDSANYTANFFQSGNDYKLSFTAVPVPETDTYLLMLAGLGLVGFRVLRRRQVGL